MYGRITTHRQLVESHLELVEVEPGARVRCGQVVVEVASGEAERVKLSIGRQQDARRRLLVDDARVATLPLAHHVDAAAAVAGRPRRRRRRRRRLVREAESVAAERCTCNRKIGRVSYIRIYLCYFCFR